MIVLDGASLTLAQTEAVASGEKVSLSPAARERVERARNFVEEIVARKEVVYGINTGFGALSEVSIPAGELRELQLNLVRSHACGVGEPLPEPAVRAMMLHRANVLAKGFSGCRPTVIETLIAMLNGGVHPVIPSRGSVGASGDLAPLAHQALVTIGEGEAVFGGEKMPGGEAMRRAGLTPLQLEAKEGLALLNGTQAMTAVGGLALLNATRLAEAADVIGAMTLEALRGTPVAFDEKIQSARPHPGQQASARRLRELIEDSEIRESHRDRVADPRVQDAYALRCMPQVHGAVRDQLRALREIFATELNAATDNPLVFVEDHSTEPMGEILSGGNFHGHPISTACDFLSILSTHLANISERRLALMMDPVASDSGLPSFLIKNSGLNSGFMIAQVAAASLVSENKILSHPASVDSIPTSANKEDYVSMGAAAAVKARNAVRNATQVLAIELLAACQALDLRAPLKPGPATGAVLDLVRQVAPTLVQDRILANDVAAANQLIASGEVVRVAERVVGEL